MEYTKKLVYQSNYWYNDGLKKAKIRDMSGALVSLRRSLQYNRENIASRNLLGLVYYGRGEVIEGLVEWIISKNFKPRDNVANYFIKKVQETPSELETIDQAIRKYNQCLIYCEQDGEDLAIIQLKKIVVAHPTFLKAHQLLALLYLKTEQYAKARQSLRKANKLDTTNEITLRYMHELNQLKGQKVKDDKAATVTYNVGNETIIQPVSSTLKDNAATITIINIIIGILMGAAVVWFLVVPAVNQSKTTSNNKTIVEYGDQIAAKNAEISAQKKQLEELRNNSAKADETMAAASGTSESYERLLAVMANSKSGGLSEQAMADQLISIQPASLGEQGKAIHAELAGSVYPAACAQWFAEAQSNCDAGNYAPAIELLTKVLAMDEQYQSGAALLLMGNAYAASGDKEKAAEKYNRIAELFPNTDAAAAAAQGLEAIAKMAEAGGR